DDAAGRADRRLQLGIGRRLALGRLDLAVVTAGHVRRRVDRLVDLGLERLGRLGLAVRDRLVGRRRARGAVEVALGRAVGGEQRADLLGAVLLAVDRRLLEHGDGRRLDLVRIGELPARPDLDRVVLVARLADLLLPRRDRGVEPLAALGLG